MKDHRPATLRAALGFAHLVPVAPELRLLHRLLDTWRGVGLLVEGLRRQGFATEFRQYPRAWRIHVRREGRHEIVGSGWAPTPWAALQDAARAAVK